MPSSCHARTTKEIYEEHGIQPIFPTWDDLKIIETVEYLKSKRGEQYRSPEDVAKSLGDTARNHKLSDLYGLDQDDEKRRAEIQKMADEAATEAEEKANKSHEIQEAKWAAEAKIDVDIYVEKSIKFCTEFLKEFTNDGEEIFSESPDDFNFHFIKRNGDLKKCVLLHMGNQVSSEFSVRTCVRVCFCVCRTFLKTCVHTYMFSYLHTYIHIHICTHTLKSAYI